jgi:hypothetical protein
VTVLKALQIKRFTISSKSWCVDMVAAFEESGCVLVGMTKVKDTQDDPNSSGLKNAFLLEVL